MVVLEAFSTEVPTAIVCVNPARLARNQEALCLDPKAGEAVWASKIDALLSQPDRLAEMVSQARILVDREFSAQAQIKEMEKIYEDALVGFAVDKLHTPNRSDRRMKTD
jgi:hypothetical protein